MSDEILLPLSQRVLHFLQNIAFLENVCGSTFDIALACLAFRRAVEVYWARKGSVGWFPYNADDGIVSVIPATYVPARTHTIEDEVISGHFNAVKVGFLVDKLFSLVNAHDSAIAVLGSKEGAKVPVEVIEERDPKESEEV